MEKWRPTLPEHNAFKAKQFQQLADVSKFIYQVGESPMLCQPSKKALIKDISSPETQEKINYIKECLLEYRKITGMGRGLAAPQVGIHESISVTYTPDQLITIINPKITKKSTTLLKYPELCMSSAPLIIYVIRPSWIEFEYYNEKGEKQYWKTKDTTPQDKMLNRVFQHEIDHLKGKLNIDRIKSSQDITLLSDPKFYGAATFEEIK